MENSYIIRYPVLNCRSTNFEFRFEENCNQAVYFVTCSVYEADGTFEKELLNLIVKIKSHSRVFRADKHFV